MYWALGRKRTTQSLVNLTEKDVEALNTGRDLPYVLQDVAGVVGLSDAGNGIGYTNMRVRGSDITRINVTVNGIPMNDAESHGVFWVNTRDLMSSTNAIQLQKGVGTSTNGSGAFGASLGLSTLGAGEKGGRITLVPDLMAHNVLPRKQAQEKLQAVLDEYTYFFYRFRWICGASIFRPTIVLCKRWLCRWRSLH